MMLSSEPDNVVARPEMQNQGWKRGLRRVLNFFHALMRNPLTAIGVSIIGLLLVVAFLRLGWRRMTRWHRTSVMHYRLPVASIGLVRMSLAGINTAA